jgi:hypothetical protein
MSTLPFSAPPSFEDEPVVYMTLVGAVLSAGVAFGLPIDPEQKTALLGVVWAAAALFTRQQVYPASHVALSTKDVLEAHAEGAVDPASVATLAVEPAVEPGGPGANETK